MLHEAVIVISLLLFMISTIACAAEIADPIQALPSKNVPAADVDAKIARAARLSVNSAYASCDQGNHVHTLASPSREDPGDDQGNSPEEENVQPKGSNGCAFKPAHYSQRTERLVVHGREVNPTPDNGTDCSGFVSGVLCRIGARLKPGDDACGPSHTSEMIDWGNSSDCFRTAEFTAMEQLRAGCIIIWRNLKTGYGHTVIVDKAGSDPFVLNGITSCDSPPDMTKWDFGIAESLMAKGPSRWTAPARFSRSRLDKPALALIYKQACKAAVSGRAMPADITEKDWRSKIICHAGKGKPGCLGAERVFKDENCIARCTP